MTTITSDASYNNSALDASANRVDFSMNHVYTGTVYAFQALGGYSVTQAFDTVHRLVETTVNHYDTTGAVEVLFDVRTLNAKLGITKDSSNILITSTNYYDSSNNVLNTDSITITAAQFITAMNTLDASYTSLSTTNVVSVGKLSTMYSDFTAYVGSYFGLASGAHGFSTLFSAEYDFNPNNGVFNTTTFSNLISASSTIDASGAYITDLSGSITISGISKLLRNAVDANPFGNRDPSGGKTAGDPADHANYGVSDGFYENDMFFIPQAGITITLNLTIDNEAFPIPLNNVGPVLSSATGASQSATFNAFTNTSEAFTSVSQSTAVLITRTLTAPLLIRAANLS